MSRILLISSDRVLGQIINMFLFRYHDVDITGHWDEDKVNASSLLIVDGSAAEFAEVTGSDLLGTIQRSHLPTLWLAEKGEACPIKRNNLLSVAKPLGRDSFQMALDTLLSPKGSQGGHEALSRGAVPKAHGAVGKKARRKKQTQKVDPAPIELVEVVEDPPSESGEQPTR